MRHISIWIINKTVCFLRFRCILQLEIMADMLNGPYKCPEYCLTQSLLGTIIFLHFNSYLCKGKEETHATMLQRRPCTILEEDVIFCLLPVGVCIDAYVTIRSYVLCVSTH